MAKTAYRVLCGKCGDSLGRGFICNVLDEDTGLRTDGLFFPHTSIGAGGSLVPVGGSAHIPELCIECDVNRRGSQARRKRDRKAAEKATKPKDDGGVS